MIEYVFYAKQPGEPDWAVDIIGVETAPPTECQMQQVRDYCSANGLEFVRVTAIDLSKPPDFAGTVR